MATLQFTEALVHGTIITTFEMPDRRPGAAASRPTRWCLQMQLEDVLFGKKGPTTGAFYRLLGRTPGAKGRALCLRNKSTAVGNGLVSEAEWDALVGVCHQGVRSLTLVPMAVTVAAITVFGETKESVAVLKALGFDPPAAWDERSAGSGEDGELSDGEVRGEGPGERSSEDHPSEDEASVATTAGNADARAGGGAAVTSESGTATERPAKAPRKVYTLSDVPPALAADLDAFEQWRLQPLQQARDGVSVTDITARGNRADALRLLGYLHAQKGVPPNLSGVFGSDRLGPAVQLFVDHLRSVGRSYTTIAGYLTSYVVLARYVQSIRQLHAPRGLTVSSVPLDAMKALHAQAMQQAHIEQAFHAKPVPALDWAGVQRARATAVRRNDAHVAAGGDAEPAAATALFEACLLTWLSSVPPDRVSVARKLQLGVTLVATASGFELNLATPDAHKTSAAFGPSVTTVPEAAAVLLRDWLATAELSAADRPFVFLPPGRCHSHPLPTDQWTRLVKALFAKHGGAALCPKDLRAAFIGFLRSGGHSDTTLRSAAFAMRHSERMAASGAYDRTRGDRLSAAAVRANQAFAAQF
jgi:hypothetical protein